MSLCKYAEKIVYEGFVRYNKFNLKECPIKQVQYPIKKNYHFFKPNHHIIKTSVRSMITKTSSPVRFKIFDRICIGTENFNTHSDG